MTPEDTQKQTILIVDDSPDNLTLMNGLLKDTYRTKVANNGERALAIAATPPLPDLILLDIMMPGIDGYEVCQRLKADPAVADIPVIFLTGKSDREDEQRGLDLGAADYITKPISPPILAARVRNHLALYQRSQKLRNLADQLSRFLPPQIYSSIFEGSRDASVTTQRKKLTICFSDIANFTKSTEELEPEDLTWLLNNYLTEMSRIAMEYGGTLDNFIGDATVIFFGDPETQGVEKDAAQCVQMAIAMQKRMTELQKLWHDMGYEKPFKQRVGVHTGYCNVGNFGSDLRINYTAIGGAVNLAARLQQSADPGGILLSYETHALVQKLVVAEERPAVEVKGISRSLKTYAVTGPANRQA